MEDEQQAFPAGTSTSFYVEGMTLLQWYAGQAMPAAALDVAHVSNLPEFGNADIPEAVATLAFAQARAMIREYARLCEAEG